MRPRSRILRLATLPLLGLAVGCDRPGPVAPDEMRTASTPEPAPAAEPTPAPAPAPVQPREILGKKTQDVRDASVELKQGGAQVGSTRIVAKDPITLAGNSYVTIVGKSAILNIEHAVDLFRATNDRYPKDYDEFKSAILKENNIALPQLPYHQEYGYDANEHKLIILEYPDRKAQVDKQGP